MAKKKLEFSARKDPLLRPRAQTKDAPGAPTTPAVIEGAASPAEPSPPVESQREAAPATASGGDLTAAWATRAAAKAVKAPRRASPRATRSGARNGEVADGVVAVAANAPNRVSSSRRSAQRVQTTVRLPPHIWDSLDEPASAAGVSSAELLSAILTRAIPDSASDALAALEQLLPTIAADEGPQEERNCRLPVAARSQLDALTEALGGRQRVRRSLLIRALIADHTPSTGEAAHELITTRRIDELRAAMHAAG